MLKSMLMLPRRRKKTEMKHIRLVWRLLEKWNKVLQWSVPWLDYINMKPDELPHHI